MRLRSLIAAIMVVLLAAGCSSAADTRAPDSASAGGGSSLSAARLRIGMIAEEARSVAGEPALVEEQNCSSRQTVWRFADGGVAILRDGRVAFHYP